MPGSRSVSELEASASRLRKELDEARFELARGAKKMTRSYLLY
ncbi:MAG TPA: hypothetical protein VMT12_04715 [Syntrophales bacterium]|nr:hypothetical protein [Syntrophales bacterium]